MSIIRANWATTDQCDNMFNFIILSGIAESDNHKWFACKAEIAKTVVHLMRDDRSKRAVEIAEAYGRGEATEGELEQARDSAYAATHHGDKSTRAAYSLFYKRFATYSLVLFCSELFATDATSHITDSGEWNCAYVEAIHKIQSDYADIIRKHYPTPPTL